MQIINDAGRPPPPKFHQDEIFLIKSPTKTLSSKDRGSFKAQCIYRLIRYQSVVSSNPIKGFPCFLEHFKKIHCLVLVGSKNRIELIHI